MSVKLFSRIIAVGCSLRVALRKVYVTPSTVRVFIDASTSGVFGVSVVNSAVSLFVVVVEALALAVVAVVSVREELLSICSLTELIAIITATDATHKTRQTTSTSSHRRFMSSGG